MSPTMPVPSIKVHSIAGLLLFAITCGDAGAQNAVFVAPPRTIADITAILDQEKPDPKTAEALRAAADAVPPAGAPRPMLARFHYDRSQARATLGDYRGALSDAQMALEIGGGVVSPPQLQALRLQVANVYGAMGEQKKRLDVLLLIEQAGNSGAKGSLFSAYRQLTDIYLTLGNLKAAEAYLDKAERLIEPARSWPNYNGPRRPAWEAEVETIRAYLYNAHGQYREAETAFGRAEALRREQVALMDTAASGLLKHQIERVADSLLSSLGRLKALQGRMAEGEADARRALLNELKRSGKYNAWTVGFIRTLSNLLTGQGRYLEAEKLARIEIEIVQSLGFADHSEQMVRTLAQLGSILALQERWQEAAQVYAELDAATTGWELSSELATIRGTPTARIAAMYRTGKVPEAIAMAEKLVPAQRERFGETHIETALARGTLAAGLVRAGRDAEAMREFQASVPILLSSQLEPDVDQVADRPSRQKNITGLIEWYIHLLARTGGAAAAAESFRVADMVRSRSVESAIAASSVRAAARNPATAELVRASQDLEKQVRARLGLLNSALALPSDQRDEDAVKALQTEIDGLRRSRDDARRVIAAKFPDYFNLLEAPQPTADALREVLRADEVFLSIFFARDATFVWALPKAGPIGFVSIPITSAEANKKILKLREALEPNADTIGEIPPFDLALAHEIYTLLLKPVEAVWRPAKNLIVATNGALGLLPLGLLPTVPAAVDTRSAPLFTEYRSVPWLARTHAITMVPSAGALRTLRQLPPGPASREKFIGFGDPLFSIAQAAEVQAEEPHKQPVMIATAARGAPLKLRARLRTSEVDSAALASLPRLPDTADELKSIALALQADPSKVLHLGKDANERTIQSTDLANYRIVAFATHGLIPGDLDGLTQPALALTAPNVADVDGDGLLTMDEILALKLNADWVILSACNTGAGAVAGAEAASGLGRAFFYAGSRALLLTNWSVHSDAARALVTDLFRRQTADSKLSRGEALRQAMMALLDGPGHVDQSGKTLFSYGHPLFWAPYSIIGDNGP